MKKRVPLGSIIILIIFGFLGYQGYHFYQNVIEKNRILQQIIQRLVADSRIAEVLVTDEKYNPITQRSETTIKFLEYDTKGDALEPRYFTFSGNVIQFQSLVIRFNDLHIKQGDALRGKSVYLFWKAFILDGANTQEYELAKMNAVPEGYKIDGGRNAFEEELWRNFWEYALHSETAMKNGVKNAQIEAPGTKFVPGVLYSIKIEHDGGLRIDAQKIPEILKGEKIE
ncbi:MAG: hypothetical protein NUV91_05525 [Candidatus Omnitrophica bacterium]|nr:hypothetical protein [Candidatus Omnitrophota bacterium]